MLSILIRLNVGDKSQENACSQMDRTERWKGTVEANGEKV